MGGLGLSVSNVTAAVIALASTFAVATAGAVDRAVRLDRGANVSVSIPPATDLLAFDVAGRIWLQRAAGEPATPLTPPDRLARRPVISPAGRQLTYEALVDRCRQVFVQDLASGRARQVTFGAFDHLAPAWRPSAGRPTKIVMSSNRGGTFDLWQVDTESLELEQLTFGAGAERDPAWNATGTQLVYIADDDRASTIYALTPGGRPRALLRERAQLFAPAWRPGGGVLTYTRQTRARSQLRMLILSEPPITKPITLTEQAFPFPVQWLDRQRFVYSADGKIRQRAFGGIGYVDIPFLVELDDAQAGPAARVVPPSVATTHPVRGIAGMTRHVNGTVVAAALGDLWAFRVAGDDILKLTRQLTNDAFVDAQPDLSPDGRHVAFVSDRGGTLQVWTLELATLALRRLTSESVGVSHPVWNADGTAIGFISTDDPAGNQFSLQQVDPVTGGVTAVQAGLTAPARPVAGTHGWETFAPRNAIDGFARLPPLPLTWRERAPDAGVIVRAGRIFDGIGPGYVTGHEIVIDAGRITDIRPWTGADDSRRVIDATDQTVLPGLIDVSARQLPANDERLGRKWLAAGVTTIRETVTDLGEAVERRESWLSGRRPGPALTLSLRACVGPMDATAYDALLRLINRSPSLGIVAIELCPTFPIDRLNHLIEHAHAHAVSVIAAAPLAVIAPGIDEILPQPADPVAGPGPVNQDYALMAGESGAVLPSRLAAGTFARTGDLQGLTDTWQFRQIFTRAERRGYAASGRAEAPPDAAAASADVNRIAGLGGRIVIGSGAPLVPHGLGLQAELRVLAASGLQPFQILKMAGLDAARVLGVGENRGLVRIGQRADLVVVDGDPLADIRDAARIRTVIVGGRPYSRASLTRGGRRAPTVGKFYSPTPDEAAFAAFRP